MYRELKKGVVILDDKGQPLGESTIAAKKGITAVTFSRILMACPGMGNFLSNNIFF